MIARLWRGWTSADFADEVASHLAGVALARYADAPGNHAVHLFRRPTGGGVELMTISVWASEADVPAEVAEEHRLLVAGQTLPATWEVVEPPARGVRRAA
jgi:hypothetical protein